MAVSNINNTDTTTTTIDLKRKAVDDNDNSSKTSGGGSPTKKKRAANNDCVPGTGTAVMVDDNAKATVDGTTTAATTTDAVAPPPTAAARMKKTSTIAEKERWQVMFDQLKQYKEEHGTCNVGLDDGKLGRWVKYQRYRYRTNTIRPGQLEALTYLGFKWRLQHHVKPRNKVDTSFKDEQFATMVDRFVRYIEETGNRWIPTAYHDKQLAHWGYYLRSQKRNGKLSEDRITVLEKVGFVWEKKKKVYQK